MQGISGHRRGLKKWPPKGGSELSHPSGTISGVWDALQVIGILLVLFGLGLAIHGVNALGKLFAQHGLKVELPHQNTHGVLHAKCSVRSGGGCVTHSVADRRRPAAPRFTSA